MNINIRCVLVKDIHGLCLIKIQYLKRDDIILRLVRQCTVGAKSQSHVGADIMVKTLALVALNRHIGLHTMLFTAALV